MGLIKCIDCGHDVSDRAPACPKCGGPIDLTQAQPNEAMEPLQSSAVQEAETGSKVDAPSDGEVEVATDGDSAPTPQSKDNVFIVLGVGVAAALLLMIAFIGANSGNGNSKSAPSSEVATEEAVAAGDAVGLPAPNAVDAAPDQTAPSGPWSYSTSEDKIRARDTFFARTTSTNSISQSAPYSSLTSMEMTLRSSPAYGTDVILTISSGQMMCPSYDGCSGTVKFDNGPPQSVSFNGPADNSSDTIFVIGAKGFIQKLKKAKKVVIEKTLYQAGNPQFEFDVSDLKWDH